MQPAVRPGRRYPHAPSWGKRDGQLFGVKRLAAPLLAGCPARAAGPAGLEVSIASPVPGAVAGGRVTLAARVAGAPPGTRVRWLLDGFPLSSDDRVLEPTRAAPLTAHKARAYLIDEASRTALAVPAMENVGELRQVARPEERRTYYMLFGNPGRLVKRGSRVTIVVGNLRAAGLTGPAYDRSLVIADQDVRLLTPQYVHRMLPAAQNMKPGVFCFNPPYGVRMTAGDEKELLALSADMGRVLSRFSGWRAVCFVANPRFVEMFGYAPAMTKPATNAELRGNFLVYEFR